MMTVRGILRAALFVTLFSESPARAEVDRVVEGVRIRLSDITQVQDPELAQIDLGPAPPAGSSRLFARSEIFKTLATFGVDAERVSIPRSVRVSSASRRFTPKDLEALVEPGIRRALPLGVTLKNLRVARPLLASPQVRVGEVRIPRLARRPGNATLTASVDLLHEDLVAARLPVTLTVELSQAAGAPLVRKGSRIDLVIARGAARISASAVALEDGDLGEIRSFRVSSTSKILRARLESSTLARVVTP